MSVVGNEARHGRSASGRRFERRQGWRSEIKRAAPPGCRAAVELGCPSRAALRDQKRISGGAFWNVQTSNGVTLVAYGSENN